MTHKIKTIRKLNNKVWYIIRGIILIKKYYFTEIELSKLDEKLIQILAWQRLQQLLPNKQSVTTTVTKKGVLNGLFSQSG